jgi:SAM-dependent methyltransferase
MDVDDNAAQRAFWNDAPGRNWITHEAALDALHAGVTGILLAAAVPAPGERILDVGCGAGATTIAFAAAVGPTGTVTGLDISEPLLARAAERARDAGAANVAFIHADAAHHPLDGMTCDAVVSRFGLMFFAHPVAAFRNIATALRPGGRLVFAAWAGPEVNPWFTLPLEAAVARLGAPEPTPPDAPGPMAFRDRDRVLGILDAAGLIDTRAEPRAVDLCLPDLEAAVALTSHVGAATRLIRDKGGNEADARAIAEGVRERLASYVDATGLRIPAEITLFSGTRL